MQTSLFTGQEKSLTGTIFSPCRRYRYTLWRSWGKYPEDFLMVIGLNPSTADEMTDDPTVRRCIGFAKSWGHSGLLMTNLFAFRATDPREMLNATDPVGPDSDRYLVDYAGLATMILAAWGNHGVHQQRAAHIKDLIKQPMYCLGSTKLGQPRHPLYLAKTAKPILW